jgi:hypothetical protein
MSGIARVNGGVGVEGVINGASGALVGASIKFFLITVKNVSNSARDLRGEMAAGVNGGLGGVVETLLKIVPSGILAYSVTDDNSGTISIAVDGHAAFAAATSSATQPGLQEMIRALGTSVPTAGGSTMDVSGSTVAAATTFAVA